MIMYEWYVINCKKLSSNIEHNHKQTNNKTNTGSKLKILNFLTENQCSKKFRTW